MTLTTHAERLAAVCLSVCRCVGSRVAHPLQLLCVSVFTSEVHGRAKTQISLLYHKSRHTMLRLLRSVNHHIRLAACMRRTRRSR